MEATPDKTKKAGCVVLHVFASHPDNSIILLDHISANFGTSEGPKIYYCYQRIIYAERLCLRVRCGRDNDTGLQSEGIMLRAGKSTDRKGIHSRYRGYAKKLNIYFFFKFDIHVFIKGSSINYITQKLRFSKPPLLPLTCVIHIFTRYH